MLSNISSKLQSLVQKIKGQKTFNEKNIKDIIQDIRIALIESDVHYEITENLIDSLQRKVIGQKISKKSNPSEAFLEIVYEEILEIISQKNIFSDFKKNNFYSILFLGLQGSGKTTNIAKLAFFLKETNPQKKILLCSSDTQRAAAQEQLGILAKNAGIDFFDHDLKSAIKISKAALKKCRAESYDVLLMDTAGRLELDDTLMKELVQITSILKPDYRFFVLDAMAGQNAFNIFQKFNERLNINHILVSKYDSDSHAGTIFSIKSLFKNVSISFVGTGENLKDLDQFHPNRFVKEILGYGNIEGFIEKIQKNVQVSDKTIKNLSEKKFDLEDYLSQLQQLKNLGNLKDLFKMIPGVGSLLKGKEALTEELFKVQESLILSMTPRERKNFKLVQSNVSRRKRIAKGSGRTMQDMNKLVKQFLEMQKLFKKMHNNNSMFNNLLQNLNFSKKK